MVSPDGEVLGTHQGYFGFTVGQRKGLGLSRPAEDGRPRYVIETRPATNEARSARRPRAAHHRPGHLHHRF